MTPTLEQLTDYGLQREGDHYVKYGLLADLRVIYDLHLDLPPGIHDFMEILGGTKKGILECGNPARDFGLPGCHEFILVSLGKKERYMILTDATTYNALSKEAPVLQLARFFSRQDQAILREEISDQESPLVKELFALVEDHFSEP